MKTGNKVTLLSMFILMPLSASAEDSIIAKYKRCVAQEKAKLEVPEEIEAYDGRGCTTDGTTWDGKRDSCSKNVCWSAPPYNLILEATIRDVSANGSSHDIGQTEYLPNREFATEICTKVSARSPGGHSSGRGWQKISAKVKIQRQITAAERAKIEADCESKVIIN